MTRDDQKALVNAYREVPQIVLEDIASLVTQKATAGDVLARIIKMRGRK